MSHGNTVQNDILANVKVHQSLSAYQVPYKTFLATLPHKPDGLPYQWIAVGALTFDSQGRILLLQRASTDSMPNLWEIPGGGCDPEDPSIIYAVVRELEEEAGLKAASVGLQLSEGYIFPTRSGKIVCKFNFLVEVEDGEAKTLDRDEHGWVKVKLDPNEHQNYVWATEEDVQAGSVGDVKISFTTVEQSQVIVEAFTARRKMLAETNSKTKE